MNHFFALPLPDEVREELGQLAEDWRSLGVGRASWYAPADYHITLKFLGNLDPSRQPDLIEAVLPVAAQMAPFEVDLNCPAGAFPNLRSPRVLWAGVKESKPMADLAAKIDAAMAALGFATERRRFNAHITLARCRENRAGGARAWPVPGERPFPIFTADRFVLMQTLPPEKDVTKGRIGEKLRYNTVRTFPFGLAKTG